MIDSHMFKAGIPTNGNTQVKTMIDINFSKKVRLKIPYRFGTVNAKPTNHTNGAVKKKNTIGYLKILTAIFLTPLISSYCFLVKRMV